MINQRMKMDIKKFKSVAVAIETYKILKKLAALDDRSAGMEITHLVKQEAKKRKIHEKET